MTSIPEKHVCLGLVTAVGVSGRDEITCVHCGHSLMETGSCPCTCYVCHGGRYSECRCSALSYDFVRLQPKKPRHHAPSTRFFFPKRANRDSLEKMLKRGMTYEEVYRIMCRTFMVLKKKGSYGTGKDSTCRAPPGSASRSNAQSARQRC